MSPIVLSPGEGKSVRMPPSDADVVLKLYGADTGQQFALIEIQIEPGTFVPPIGIQRRTNSITCSTASSPC